MVSSFIIIITIIIIIYMTSLPQFTSPTYSPSTFRGLPPSQIYSSSFSLKKKNRQASQE